MYLKQFLQNDYICLRKIGSKFHICFRNIILDSKSSFQEGECTSVQKYDFIRISSFCM
jgi:hypothetical protein